MFNNKDEIKVNLLKKRLDHIPGKFRLIVNYDTKQLYLSFDYLIDNYFGLATTEIKITDTEFLNKLLKCKNIDQVNQLLKKEIFKNQQFISVL